jgi:2-phosphosulfolactate phosphatase
MNVHISHNFYGAHQLQHNLPYDFKDFCVIVVDVLRASTTITTLLELCDEIYITDSIEDVEAQSFKDFIKVGERNGKKIEDFDFGNSPLEIKLNGDNIISQTTDGKSIILTTTNGTRVLKSILSDNILIGSITNAKYVADAAYKIAKENEKDILIIPCHRKGSFAIEDYIGAGLIAKYVLKNMDDKIYSEELIPVLNLVKSDWKSLIFNGSSANNLKNLGYHKDLIFCTSENSQKSVGMFKDADLLPRLKSWVL